MGALQTQLHRDPHDRVLARESLRADFAEAALGLVAVEPLFRRALEALVAGLEAEAGCLVELDGGRPVVRAALGFGESTLAVGHWLLPTQRVVRGGEPVWVGAVEAKLCPELMPEPFREAGLTSALALPLPAGSQGAIWVGWQMPFTVTLEAREFPAAVSRILGAGLSRLQGDRGLHRFRASVDHLVDAILVMRSDGTLLDANQTAVELYGYSREELFERSILDLRAGPTLPEVLWQMRRAGRGGLIFETLHRRKDGSQFRCEVRSRGATLDGEHVLVSLIRRLDPAPPGSH